MIKQYQITIRKEEEGGIPYDLGYQFYGMLLELIPPEFSNLIHNNSINPLNQYVMRGKDANTIDWTINLLGEEACQKISPILEKTNRFMLRKNNMSLAVKDIKAAVIPDDNTLLIKAHELFDYQKPSVAFLTPTSFKQEGTYQLFPTVEYMIHNLIHRWNSYSETFIFDDEDAVKSLIDGIKIAGYDLHSNYYKMKGIQIPAFRGELRFVKKLSIPMAELFNLLLLFAEYSGVGIKTSLGMGAVKVSFK